VSDHKIDDNSINSPQKHSTRVLHECVDCFPQVVDTSGRMNPTSLSLHIFGGEIPNDRKTEYRSEFAEVSSTPTMFLQHSAPTFGPLNPFWTMFRVPCGALLAHKCTVVTHESPLYICAYEKNAI